MQQTEEWALLGSARKQQISSDSVKHKVVCNSCYTYVTSTSHLSTYVTPITLITRDNVHSKVLHSSYWCFGCANADQVTEKAPADLTRSIFALSTAVHLRASNIAVCKVTSTPCTSAVAPECRSRINDFVTMIAAQMIASAASALWRVSTIDSESWF